jgi:hypothetical protein
LASRNVIRSQTVPPRKALMRILAMAIFGTISIGPVVAQTYAPGYTNAATRR